MYKILVHIKDELPEEFPLERSGIIVGRGKASDIRIISEGVSREHAKITLIGENVFIEDLGSANGIFINDKKIEKEKLTTFFPAILSPDVKISLESEVRIEPDPTHPRIKAERASSLKKDRKPKSARARKAAPSSRPDNSKKLFMVLLTMCVAIAAYYVATEFLNKTESEAPTPAVKGKTFPRDSKKENQLCKADALKSICRAFRSDPVQGYGFYIEKENVQGSVEYLELSKGLKDGLKTKEDYKQLISSKLNGGILNGFAKLGIKVLSIDFLQKKADQEVRYTRCMIDLQKFFKANRKGEIVPYHSQARKALKELIVVIDI